MKATTYCASKIASCFKRMFNEQTGGAALISTIIIIGIVLVLSLAFRTQLTNLVASLWNSILKGNDPVIPDWQG